MLVLREEARSLPRRMKCTLVICFYDSLILPVNANSVFTVKYVGKFPFLFRNSGRTKPSNLKIFSRLHKIETSYLHISVCQLFVLRGINSLLFSGYFCSNQSAWHPTTTFQSSIWIVVFNCTVMLIFGHWLHPFSDQFELTVHLVVRTLQRYSRNLDSHYCSLE